MGQESLVTEAHDRRIVKPTDMFDTNIVESEYSYNQVAVIRRYKHDCHYQPLYVCPLTDS